MKLFLFCKVVVDLVFFFIIWGFFFWKLLIGFIVELLILLIRLFFGFIFGVEFILVIVLFKVELLLKLENELIFLVM